MDGPLTDRNLTILTLTVNGQQHEAEVDHRWTLLRVLREVLQLTGTKRGCDRGECGACTVLLEGKPVNSCMVLAMTIGDRNVVTIEGLVSEGELHPVQHAFIENDGGQCGFCTPGMILLAKTLLDENPDPTPQETRQYMDTNICRCTGYQMIAESILDAAKRMRRSA